MLGQVKPLNFRSVQKIRGDIRNIKPDLALVERK